jgi:hypothetical protein
VSTRIRFELVERAAAGFEREARARAKKGWKQPPRVITVSRSLGSGGRSVTEILARSLKWPLWDREILDVMASRSSLHYQARMFESLDETTQGGIDSALYSMLGGIHKDVYFYLLPRAILTIAQNDAVILGRGAHLLLPNALKVMLTASLATRIRRVAAREGLDEERALARVKASDRERQAFLRELADRLSYADAGRRVRTECDLIIDTDAFSLQQAASMVLHAAALKFGLRDIGEIPEMAAPASR